ncbi:MAG: type IV pilus secretin PilQ [Candidatus Omnitrophota bacterium]
MKIRSFDFKVKLGLGVLLLVFGVGSFLAANGLNEMQVDDRGEGKISVEFKDADIHDVFRVLALKGNVSIVSDQEVKGLVTVQITDVPWEKVLDVICRTYGYAYEREQNIIRVVTLDKQGQETLITEVFALNFAKAKQVSESVGEMKSERGGIKCDERSNLIIVTDIPTNIYKIGKVIEKLDRQTPQVTIEAKIIETTIGDDENLGLKWNVSASASMSKRPTTFPWPKDEVGKKYKNYMPYGNTADDFPTIAAAALPLATTDDFSFGILDASTFSLLLQAIQTRSKTQILSNPRITTMDNQPAKIHVGTDWPIASYTYNEETDRFVITGWEYKSYGILMEVTPTINNNGYVTLKIHPEISDKKEEIDFQGASVPVLTTQTAEATVMIKDGETLAIGGLIKHKKVTTKTKIPFLGDIPILGLLFTHKSEEIAKTDLLIFITPHIIGGESLVKRQKLTNALETTKEKKLTALNTTNEAVPGAEKDLIGTEDLLNTEFNFDLDMDLTEEPDSTLNLEGANSDVDKGKEEDLTVKETKEAQLVQEPVEIPKKEEVSEKKTGSNKGYLFKKK